MKLPISGVESDDKPSKKTQYNLVQY